MDSQNPVYWSGATDVWIAQSFTASENYDIDGVILKMYREAEEPGNITLAIRAVDGEGKPTGDDLCSVTINANDITTDSNGEEVTFEFDSSTSLTNGTKYTIVLKSPANESTYVRWILDSSNASYAGGNYLYSEDAGSTWAVDTGADFYFKTFSLASPLGSPIMLTPGSIESWGW